MAEPGLYKANNKRKIARTPGERLNFNYQNLASIQSSLLNIVPFSIFIYEGVHIFPGKAT